MEKEEVLQEGNAWEDVPKVSEFENGVEDPPYQVSKSFQQMYGPESNFSYRVNDAAEILDYPRRLKAMIMDHYENQRPRLEALDEYMKARNGGIYRDGSRRVEKGKADYRAAHNFAKVINAFDVGYNTGIPIKKESDIERVTDTIKEYDRENDIEALDAELWRDMKKYGRAYELQYRNGQDKDCSVISSVFETFVCYSLDVERQPLFAVRYPRYRIGEKELVTVIVYTDTKIITYKSCPMNALKLVIGQEEDHYWGEVPITEYSPDRYRQSGYEDVIPLIDLYDSAQSDTANYMSDLNEATLVVTGDLDLRRYSVDDVVKMKRANLLLLANGMNPDGSKSQTDARYIYKQYDVNGAEAYKERIRKDIHAISLVPDLNDDSFAGTQSGEAMKYKLFGFQQIAKTGQNGFRKGLMRRYRLLLNIKNYVSEAENTDLGNLTITFTPNLPKAVLDELKVLVDSGAEFSRETLVGLASFVEDIKQELEKVDAEKEEEQDTVIKNMFKDVENGQQDVLEGKGAGESAKEP